MSGANPGHGREDARRAVCRALWRLAVPLALGAAAQPCPAQDNPALRNAVQLATEGHGDSARRIVALEMAKATRGDPAYVEALYWRGRLALSGDSAEHDLRRVAIEYSTSRWADQALLQLAQLAMAAGNSSGALQLAERLRSDYPTSTLRARAAWWAGRAAIDIGDPAAACALLDSARNESADVEFLNQVAFYRNRCGAVAVAPPADSVPPARGPGDTAGAESTAAPRPPTQYVVQVTATRTSSAAEAVLGRVTRSGEKARIVKGADGYLRVRAGPYPTEREAVAAASRLQKALGGHPFVVPAL